MITFINILMALCGGVALFGLLLFILSIMLGIIAAWMRHWRIGFLFLRRLKGEDCRFSKKENKLNKISIIMVFIGLFLFFAGVVTAIYLQRLKDRITIESVNQSRTGTIQKNDSDCTADGADNSLPVVALQDPL
jgi:hypothetical protein